MAWKRAKLPENYNYAEEMFQQIVEDPTGQQVFTLYSSQRLSLGLVNPQS